jgi:hypothetical protein
VTAPLASLSAVFLVSHVLGRRIGLGLDCPCCLPGQRVRVLGYFDNPPQGPRSAFAGIALHHHREGDTLETLSLAPELTGPCGHRLWVTDGQVTSHAAS